MVPSLPLQYCESSVSVKENPDREKSYHIWDYFWKQFYLPGPHDVAVTFLIFLVSICNITNNILDQYKVLRQFWFAQSKTEVDN